MVRVKITSLSLLLVSAALFSASFSTPAEASKLKGAAIGAGVGALVGGSKGAVVGGVAGAVIADD